MLSKRLLGIVLACALLLCGCMTGEHSPEESPVLDTPDARAAFTREAMMFTEMLFAGLPCEGTVTENGVQYPVVAHEQYPTYQSLVDALNWYFDPALAGALKEAMPYAEVQSKPVKTRDTATAGAQFDKATVTADSAEGLTLTVPSSQGDLTVSITLKDGRISGYTGAGHPTGSGGDTAYLRFCLNAVYAAYSYCLPLWEATLPLDRDDPSATTPEFFAIVPSDMYKDHATVRQTLLGWCNEAVTDKLLAESPYTVQNGVWGLSAYEEAGGDLPDTITAVWQGGKVIATLTDGTQTARFAVTFTGTLITAVEPYDGDESTTTAAPVPAALQWLHSGTYSQGLIDELTAEWTAAQLPTDTGEEKLAFFKQSFFWRGRLVGARPDFNNPVVVGDRDYCFLLNCENCPTFEVLKEVTEWYFTPDYAANRIADASLFEHEGQVWMDSEGKGDACDWQNATLVSAEGDAIVIRVKILACGDDGIYPEENYRVTFQNGKIAGCDGME